MELTEKDLLEFIASWREAALASKKVELELKNVLTDLAILRKNNGPLHEIQSLKKKEASLHSHVQKLQREERNISRKVLVYLVLYYTGIKNKTLKD